MLYASQCLGLFKVLDSLACTFKINYPIHVLYSGESGAGKTESAKLLISQLVELSRGTSQLEQQILQVLPLPCVLR